jgi:hypothetical protein
MRVTTVFASTGLMLVAAAAAACSGSSGSGAAAPAAKTSTAAGSSAAAGSSGGSAGSAAVKKLDVCTALPIATVSQITGTTFTTTKPSSVEGVIFDCDYGGTGSALLQISVAVQNGPGDLSADVTALKAVGYAPNQVAGVGDQAFSEPDPNGNAGAIGASSVASYGAVFGQTYIKIGGLTYVTPAQGKQIVEDLHSKL